jgi:hypothetical protein
MVKYPKASKGTIAQIYNLGEPRYFGEKKRAEKYAARFVAFFKSFKLYPEETPYLSYKQICKIQQKKGRKNMKVTVPYEVKNSSLHLFPGDKVEAKLVRSSGDPLNIILMGENPKQQMQLQFDSTQEAQNLGWLF